MSVNMPDYSFKGGDPTQTILAAYQNKYAQEKQMEQQAVAQQQAKIQQVQQVFAGAAQMTGALVTHAKMQSQLNAQNALASLLAKGNSTPTTPAQSSLFPTMTEAAAPQTDAAGSEATSPLNTTPGYQSKLKSLALKAFPEEASKAYAKQLFPDDEAAALKQAKLDDQRQAHQDLQENRKNNLEVAKINAGARVQNADTNSARLQSSNTIKLANAVDETKLKDYDRLTAAKRLDTLVQQAGGEPNRFQVKDASIMLTGLLQGGGRGGVIAEKLINDLTPSTVGGTVAKKLEWLTNHPESTNQAKFLQAFKDTADREAEVAEDNIRQQQIEALSKYKPAVDREGWNDVLNSIGLSEENIGPKGKYVKTGKERKILPSATDSGSRPSLDSIFSMGH